MPDVFDVSLISLPMPILQGIPCIHIFSSSCQHDPSCIANKGSHNGYKKLLAYKFLFTSSDLCRLRHDCLTLAAEGSCASKFEVHAGICQQVTILLPPAATLRVECPEIHANQQSRVEASLQFHEQGTFCPSTCNHPPGLSAQTCMPVCTPNI